MLYCCLIDWVQELWASWRREVISPKTHKSGRLQNNKTKGSANLGQRWHHTHASDKRRWYYVTIHVTVLIFMFLHVWIVFELAYDLRSMDGAPADAFSRIRNRTLWSMLLWWCNCKIMELVHARITYIYAARRRTGMMDELCYIAV